MIRFLFRFVGLWILAAGFVALVRDGTKSIAANSVFITNLADDWNNIHGTSLEQAKALVEKYAGPAIWELVTAYVLGAPTWLVLGVVGSLFILIGRRKKPLIGYGRD